MVSSLVGLVGLGGFNTASPHGMPQTRIEIDAGRSFFSFGTKRKCTFPPYHNPLPEGIRFSTP